MLLLHKMIGRRWIGTRSPAPSNDQTLSTLRRFLLHVHPDLIPNQDEYRNERETNTRNVGTLQAYLRQHSYTGSASLLFHKKPNSNKVLETVRVIVGRGVDTCLNSMLLAMGETPLTHKPRPSYYEPERVADILGRRRRRRAGGNAFDISGKSFGLYMQQLTTSQDSKDSIKNCRRAAQHATARGMQLIERYGFRFVKSRCGWTPRHVAQVLTAIDNALRAQPIAAKCIKHFGLIITTTDTLGPVDVDQGFIYASPSRQLEDIRKTIETFTPTIAQRFAQHSQNLLHKHSRAEIMLSLHFGRCIRLECGATTSAHEFEYKCLNTLVAASEESVPNINDKRKNSTYSEDALVIRIERDAPRTDARTRFINTGTLLCPLPVTIDAVANTLAAVDASDIRTVFENRRKLQNLARMCVDQFRLRDLELYLDGNEHSLRFYNRASTYYQIQHKTNLVLLSAASRPRGASIPALIDAMKRLLLITHSSISVDDLNDTSLALIGGNTPTTHNELGQILLPFDFVL